MPIRKRSPHDDKAVKLARDLALKAKLIAEVKGLSISEYLSGIVRPFIEKDWLKAMDTLDKHES